MARHPSRALGIVGASFMIGIGAIGFCDSGAQAEPVADFYRGKKIFVVSSSAPGGGYDQYARLLARNLGRHVPGEPSIIVQNMPGAEGVKAANYIYNVGAQDGTFIGALPRTLSLSKLYAHKGAQTYDPFGFQWLGSLKRDTGILVVNAKSGVMRPEDLRSREISLSSQAVNSPNSMFARMLNALYGSKLKPVEGYEGSTAGLLAVERAEVDGHITGGTPAPIKNKVNGWIKAGQGKVILQFGLNRDMDFPDAPSVLELVTDPEGRKLLELAFTEQEMGSPFVLGPKVPNERVEALRAAFVATAEDAAFLSEAAHENAPIHLVDAAGARKLLEAAYSAPPDLVQRLRNLAAGANP